MTTRRRRPRTTRPDRWRWLFVAFAGVVSSRTFCTFSLFTSRPPSGSLSLMGCAAQTRALSLFPGFLALLPSISFHSMRGPRSQ
uniref:Putative secreted peptide n=1 Tax=Anopheles braziliensis TaxID=58242 RepID=A0A2M3ZTI6_9DIPT